MIITLDGPCGSGKSTLAQLLAKRLGFFYINSGYLYRSVAYVLVKDFGYDYQQLQAPDVDHIHTILHADHFVYQYADGIARVYFKNIEITHHLKASTVSDHASLISSHLHVRHVIVATQRRLGSMHHLITDGRDGGTEIYPQADFKFYVIADDAIRAQRLQNDAARIGTVLTFEQALQMTQMRDQRDMNRLISPLKKAHDAIVIDTSLQSVHKTLDAMIQIIQKSSRSLEYQNFLRN